MKYLLGAAGIGSGRRAGRRPVITPTLLLILWGLTFHSSLAHPQKSPADSQLSAQELLRRVVDEELKAQANNHSHWMYKVTTREAGKEEVKWVVETREGELDRLQSVNGHPITHEQEEQEDRRIQQLLRKSDERKKRRHAQAEDDKRMESLFRTLPDAVLAKYGERRGELVEILFKPNPSFHASSHEAAVFHAMEGRIWVNERENRLAEIEGHLIRKVKFFGGLLGYLDKGGEFHVRQTEVSPGDWEITLLVVNMHGKALFFKTISVQENQIRTDLKRVPDNLTLAAAAKELQRLSAMKSASERESSTPEVQTQRSKIRYTRGGFCACSRVIATLCTGIPAVLTPSGLPL
ncbi:MAG: hypothetical protein WB566_02935 [Terriglobales bacterium]